MNERSSRPCRAPHHCHSERSEESRLSAFLTALLVLAVGELAQRTRVRPSSNTPSFSGKGPGVRFTALALILAALIALATGASAATTHHHRRHHYPKPAATPTPKPTPAIVMRPMVLITGGTGTISVP